jgi:hypothetical protein
MMFPQGFVVRSVALSATIDRKENLAPSITVLEIFVRKFCYFRQMPQQTPLQWLVSVNWN